MLAGSRAPPRTWGCAKTGEGQRPFCLPWPVASPTVNQVPCGSCALGLGHGGDSLTRERPTSPHGQRDVCRRCRVPRRRLALAGPRARCAVGNDVSGAPQMKGGAAAAVRYLSSRSKRRERNIRPQKREKKEENEVDKNTRRGNSMPRGDKEGEGERRGRHLAAPSVRGTKITEEVRGDVLL